MATQREIEQSFALKYSKQIDRKAQMYDSDGKKRPFFQRHPLAKRRIRLALAYLVRFLWAFGCMFPFYYSIVIALKVPSEIVKFSLWPQNPTLANFLRVFQTMELYIGLANTMLVTIIQMAGNIVVSLLAGYSFARLKFKGKKVVFKIMELSMMLPFAVVFIPTFIVLARFPLVGGNNILGQGGFGFTGPTTMFLGIILPSVISVYNIFFLKQFFMTLPKELGESAKIDGANEFKVFHGIYLPLILPALGTLAVFTFQAGWNNYTWPAILSQEQFMVLTIVLRSVYNANVVDQGFGMAMTLVITAPMIVIFFSFQRLFMSGISSGGVKD